MAETIQILVEQANTETSVSIEQSTTVVQVDVSAAAPIGDTLDSALSGEAIPSYTPVAVINGIAYRYDAADITHLMAFAGFSINGVSNTGETVLIRKTGIISLNGWGLTVGSHYLSGLDGAISTTLNPSALFKRVLGYAQTADKLNILNYNPVINS